MNIQGKLFIELFKHSIDILYIFIIYNYMKSILEILFICSLFISSAFAQHVTVISVTPAEGVTGDTITTTIFGSGFVMATTIDFGDGVIVLETTFFTSALIASEIYIEPTAVAGYRSVIASNPGGESDTLIDGFLVTGELDPPECELICPENGAIFSFCDTAVLIALSDENGIHEGSVLFEIADSVYTYDSPQLTISGDTLLRFAFNTESFEHVDTIHFELQLIADTLGNETVFPINGFFVTDKSPPQILSTFPPMNSSVGFFTYYISIEIEDYPAGLDTLATGITIETEDTMLILSLASPSMVYAESSIGVNLSEFDLDFDIGDTMWVCLWLKDFAQCDPNRHDTCWFYYNPPPDNINIILEEIDRSRFPLIGANCLVLDDYGRTVSGLTEENFIVYEFVGFEWVEQHPLIVSGHGDGGGTIDIFFCLDVTGSMYSMLEGVIDGLEELTENLLYAGYSYRLGLNTFGDSVYFPFGYELTGDIAHFMDCVASLSPSGGGDGPEVSLDAINDALDSMHFRPGAEIAIVMVTDAPPHTIGDGTVYSDVDAEMVLMNLLFCRATCFIIASTWGGDEIDESYYTLADGTGGEVFPWDGSSTLPLLSSYFDEIARSIYSIFWTSSLPIADCSERNVQIAFDGFGFIDYDYYDYFTPCSPMAEIIEPPPHSWCSNPFQPIQMDIYIEDGSIDEASIRFVCNNSLYNIDTPEISFSTPVFLFESSTVYENGDIVSVELSGAQSYEGFPLLGGPVSWRFFIDLEPPYVYSISPENEEIVYDTQLEICFSIADDLSGLDGGSILIVLGIISDIDSTIEIHTIDPESPGASFDGENFCFNPVDADMEFLPGDTICIHIMRALDRITHGAPNDIGEDEIYWCFYIDSDRQSYEFPKSDREKSPDKSEIRIETQLTEQGIISINLPDNGEIEIADIAGRKLFNSSVSAGRTYIDTGNLKLFSGRYFIRVTSGKLRSTKMLNIVN